MLPLAIMTPPSNAQSSRTAEGAREWLQCRACHTLKDGEPHKLGPNLAGIMGARAGTRSGYDYSNALSRSQLVWNRANMDRWIENPNAVLRGHKMVYVGMRDPAKRRALINYITSETRRGGS